MHTPSLSPEIGGAWPTLMRLQLGQAAALVTGAASVLVVSRALGPEQYGSLTLALAVAQYVVILSVTWTSASVVRFGREEFVRTGAIRSVFGTRLAIALGCLAVAGPAVLVGGPRFGLTAGVPSGLAGLVLLLALLLTIADHFDGTLQATGAWKGFAWLAALEKLTFLALIAFAATTGGERSVRFALTAAIIAQVVRVCVAGWIIVRTRAALPPVIDRRTADNVVRYSWPQLFTFTVGYFSAFVEPLLIARHIDVASAGVYNVAYQASLFCAAVLVPIGSMLFPAVTSLRAQHREDLISRLLVRLVPQAVFVISMLAILGMVLIRFTFPFVFGDEYAGALGPLTILLAAVSFQAITIIYGPVMAAYDMTRETAMLNVIGGLALHLLPQVILIPLIGINGAAVSWMIWYATSALVSIALVQTRLGGELRSVLFYPTMAAVVAMVLVILGARVGVPLALVMVAMTVVSVQRRAVFSSQDAGLLASVGVPSSIGRYARVVYSALSRQGSAAGTRI